MGLSGISPLSLLLILAIIIALFGTSKLKTLGTDLGEAIKNFRQAMNDDSANKKEDEKPS
jgi:sec-independent protein translocase protein TatA